MRLDPRAHPPPWHNLMYGTVVAWSCRHWANSPLQSRWVSFSNVLAGKTHRHSTGMDNGLLCYRGQAVYGGQGRKPSQASFLVGATKVNKRTICHEAGVLSHNPSKRPPAELVSGGRGAQSITASAMGLLLTPPSPNDPC